MFSISWRYQMCILSYQYYFISSVITRKYNSEKKDSQCEIPLGICISTNTSWHCILICLLCTYLYTKGPLNYVLMYLLPHLILTLPSTTYLLGSTYFCSRWAEANFFCSAFGILFVVCAMYIEFNICLRLKV